MAHPRHGEVRQRYQFCCGYCGVTELETGGELTIDHHCPVSANGDDSDDNLVYACFRCNTYKGDFFPTPDDLAHARRVLHPLLDELTQHFRENKQTGLLVPLTETGRFHVVLLHLNRPQLVGQRLTRQLRLVQAEAHQLLQVENEELRLRILQFETYLRELYQRLAEEGR